MPTSAQVNQKDFVTGVVSEIHDGAIVLAIPGANYRLRLATHSPITAKPGQRISGVISAQASRIDLIKSGGRYIEPVIGPPRRVQGRITAIDTRRDTITVSAGAPVVCSTDALQSASDFQVGQMVSMNINPEATFTPAS